MNHYNLKFKCLTTKDKPVVAEMYTKTFPELPREDLDISWDYRSKADSYGIWDGAQMAGFVLASFNRRSGSSMYIEYFALEEAYRGNGLGTQLLQDYLKEFLTEKGSIHLYPMDENLTRWYVRNGFTESNKGYYVIHTYETRSKQGKCQMPNAKCQKATK